MASTIRIKRSAVSGNPTTLAAGELAYSALADNGSNGGDRLYIGMGTETAGNAANHIVIGGQYFTDKLDHTLGVLTASSAILVDANKKIDDLLVDNLELNGNTISSTDVNGNILITPNGVGKTIIGNLHIGDDSTPIAEFIYDTVGGAITQGTGITVSNNDAGNTSTVSITDTGVTAGSYGSATSIPTFTVNAQGQLTAAGSVSVATTLNITGDTGTDGISLLSETLAFVGGTGITSTVTANTVTFDIDNTVVTLSGTQILTNKTLTTPTIDIINGSTTASGTLTLRSTSSPTKATAGIIMDDAIASTSTTTGTLKVTGGVGVSGDVYAAAYKADAAVTVAAGGTNTNVVLVPNGTGTVDVSSKRITSVADPTQAQDAATKAYVDATKTGLDVKDSVRVGTTGALTATYDNGTSGQGATLTNSGTQAAITIDSIPLSVGDRVLVKDQTDAKQNGIYVVTTVGTVSTNWVLTRASDFDNSPNVEVTGGAFTFVEEGTTNADNGYVLTTNGSIVFGTSSLNWSQFSGAGQITAGDGLTKSGNTINVVGTTDRITVNADSVDIASTYVGQSSITTLGTIGTGTWQGTIVSPTYGGTGVNNGTKTITLDGNLTTSGAFATTLTVTAATSVTLPTSGTLATLSNSETLSNKTITSSSFSGTTITASGAISFTSTTDATSVNAAAVVLSGGLAVQKAIYVGTNITGAGAGTSTLDGFNIDGGTY